MGCRVKGVSEGSFFRPQPTHTHLHICGRYLFCLKVPTFFLAGNTSRNGPLVAILGVQKAQECQFIKLTTTLFIFSTTDHASDLSHFTDWLWKHDQRRQKASMIGGGGRGVIPSCSWILAFCKAFFAILRHTFHGFEGKLETENYCGCGPMPPPSAGSDSPDRRIVIAYFIRGNS